MTLGLSVLNLVGEWALCKSGFRTSEAGREKLILREGLIVCPVQPVTTH